MLQFGEELHFDPHEDPRERAGVKASLVRRKVKQALREKVSIHEYRLNDLKLEKEMEEVLDAWLKGRRGPQAFISHIRLFDDRLGKRWFYALREEKIVGLLLLHELRAKQGWLLNHLMITSSAPHGTSELLVCSTFERLAQEKCHFLTVGIVPSLFLEEILGINLIGKLCIQWAYRLAILVFRLNGKGKFWEKFHPSAEKSYLVFSKGVGLKEIRALLHAANASL